MMAVYGKAPPWRIRASFGQTAPEVNCSGVENGKVDFFELPVIPPATALARRIGPPPSIPRTSVCRSTTTGNSQPQPDSCLHLTICFTAAFRRPSASWASVDSIASARAYRGFPRLRRASASVTIAERSGHRPRIFQINRVRERVPHAGDAALPRIRPCYY